MVDSDVHPELFLTLLVLESRCKGTYTSEWGSQHTFGEILQCALILTQGPQELVGFEPVLLMRFLCNAWQATVGVHHELR